VSKRVQLLEIRETLTPADHQTHRRYAFVVPVDCLELQLQVHYAPKQLSQKESALLADQALRQQASAFAARVGEPLAARWSADLRQRADTARVSNLLTISLNDAMGAYRGAGHRQSNDQRLILAPQAASPGLVPGPLLAGTWSLTLSAHTLVSPHCEVSIQIGAEIASNRS
jgi:hypothetical protein